MVFMLLGVTAVLLTAMYFAGTKWLLRKRSDIFRRIL
jgi:hypothetical protein